MKDYKTPGTSLQDEDKSEYDGNWYTYNKSPEELNPFPPDNTGDWKMIGSVVTRTALLWFWEKEVEDDSPGTNRPTE